MARKHKLIESNPFADVSASAVNQQDRQRFILREDTDKLLAVCNPTWRTIVALCRYGGLRCPSEVLSLRWDGVADFERASGGGAECGALEAQNAAQQAHAGTRNGSQETTQGTDTPRAYAISRNAVREAARTNSGEDRIL